MLPLDFVSFVEQFRVPLYSLCREVETLTQEDRDIMDGSTFFRCINLIELWTMFELWQIILGGNLQKTNL